MQSAGFLGRFNFLRAIIFLGLLVLGYFLLRPVLGLLIGALFLAFLVNPLVELIQSRGAGRSAAALTTYLFLVMLLAIILAFIIPVVTTELRQAGQALPRLAADVQKRFAEIEAQFQRFTLPINVREALYAGLDRFRTQIETGISRLAVGIPGLFSRLLTMVLVPAMAYYISRDSSQFSQSVLHLVPRRHRDEVLRVGTDVNRALAGYIRGQLIVGLMVGVLITAGLLLLKIEFALLIGLVAGVFNVVPYLGPVLSAAPAVLLALRHGPLTPLYVILLFVAVNQIDSTFISPRIVGRHVGLHPLVIILAILAGGRLSGVVGLLAAVPVVALVKIVISHLWRRTGREGGEEDPRPVVTLAVKDGENLWLVETPLGWRLPFTTVLEGESPEDACARAARENLGFAASISAMYELGPARPHASRRYYFEARPLAGRHAPAHRAHAFPPAEAALRLQNAFHEQEEVEMTPKDPPPAAGEDAH